MTEILLMLLAFLATAICVGLYWQVQKSESRIAQQAATVREQALVVGELADEISMASTYLYEAMDRFLVDIEAQVESVRDLSTAVAEAAASAAMLPAVDPSAVTQPEPTTEEDPAWWEITELHDVALEAPTPEPPTVPTPAAVTYPPHFQALTLAAEGKDLVEIARQTGLGVEELRLLLHFQDELSIAGD